VLGAETAARELGRLSLEDALGLCVLYLQCAPDMHDCSVRTGDAWLQSWVPKITASASYQSGNTVLFITCSRYCAARYSVRS
jgi:hypothetical protein